MRFRPNARLDPRQGQERRGGGGGRGLAGRGGGLAVGGGAGTLIVIVVLSLLGVNVSGGADPYALGTGDSSPSQLTSTCKSGSDANQSEDCRIVGVVNSVQAYWGDQVR